MKYSTWIVTVLSFAGLVLPTLSTRAAIDTLVPAGAVWKYLDNGSNQGTNWITPSFNDTSWASGPAELGYGDLSDGRPEVTVVEDNPTPGYSGNDQNRYITTYFRHAFSVATPGAYAVVQLRVLRDDGVMVYLNGRAIFTNNMPEGSFDFQTPAPLSISGGDEATFLSAVVPANLLIAGQNVIAAEIHQQSQTSSDISFDLELTGNTQNNAPSVSLIAPGEGAFYTAPANISISATASDPESNISLVEFFRGTTKLGEDPAAPYTFDWTNVPLGSYALRAVATDALGAKGTSAVVNVTVGISTPPTVVSKIPAPGTVTILTNITVNFSENVTGVDASDLMINGVPARSVSGSGTSFSFAIAQPSDGTVVIGWNGAHGIVDFENPPRPFDPFGSGAAWQYTLTDSVPPIVKSLSPPAGAAVRELDSVKVTFSEPVYGVNAADLRINSVEATSVTGTDEGPYEFHFATPANGTVTFSWVAGHGITDRATARNAFAGGNWTYSLNTNAVWEGQVVINEIMYHPASERTDEEFVELRNRGTASVNLAGWRLNRAVEFTFPNISIPAGGYLVAAANLTAFNARYPGIANVVGGWTGRLSNSRDEIELEDASGSQVDLVEYADEGDWAVRTSSGVGWTWFSPADGFGRSLELRQSALENNAGQNWAPSAPSGGTPGSVNSTNSANIAPMILQVSHLPAIPRSTNSITILARIVDESTSGLTVRLWRRDATTTTLPSFTDVPMLDNGLSNDGAPGDGIYGVVLIPMGNGTITEYYVEAVDSSGNTRTWPAAADTGGGSFAQAANALFQVDDEVYAGKQPIYRMIMRASDRNGLVNNFDRNQRNATFITIEGSDVEVRHNCEVRRRGQSSFGSSPPTMKFNIPRDRLWNNKSSLNLNSVNTHAQVIGSAVALKAGLPAPYTRAVQVRFNGENRSASGGGMFGSYAHVEVADGEWARDHYPDDGNGNVYSKRRPLCGGLEYLGTDPQSYINCAYDKESNASENDWTDLINLTFAMDLDTTPDNEYVRAVERNLNVELALRHFALLFMMNYTETALANGEDDDYDLYRGIVDPRFILLPHDFDSIFGSGGSLPNNLFIAASSSSPNVGRFLHHPEFEPRFYAEYRRLLSGLFAPTNLFPLMDQVLADWVPAGTITSMKNSAQSKINYVQGAVPPAPVAVRATIAGEPDSPTYLNTATLNVGGADITHYRYRLNNGAWSADRLVSQPISLTSLANGHYTVYVVGRNSAAVWQADADATVSKTWAVLSGLRGVVINEVLALNDSAVNHEGTFPDFIELFNSGASPVDLAGLRLTDDLDDPNKFTFPAGTTLAVGTYRVVFANNADGTSGLHTGFGLSQDGDTVYLLDRATVGDRVIDRVKFGWQLSNLSVGRLGNGQWGLCTPTSGGANVAVTTGNASTLKINEWLASPGAPFVADFVELYNPDSLPVNLGGLFMTDQPIGSPFEDKITPLSFIGGFGYRAFIADGDSGSDHLNFSLSAEGGEIALMSSDGAVIDCVIYGVQSSGISQGRSPNGGSRIVYLDPPTPGAGNPAAPGPVQPTLVNLIPLNSTFLWKYEDTGTDLGTEWRATAYNDSGWPAGPALLAHEPDPLPEPIRTPLDWVDGKITYYFRAHFNLPPGLNMSALQVTHVIDDGAVFFLNGQEAGRYFMFDGPVDYGTLARNGGDAVYRGPMDLPVSMLVPGDNVIAVEVHQSSPGSSDVVFGMSLDAVIITNNPALAGIKINEVLANARASTNTDGTVTDWVELYNPSNDLVDLSGMSFTDQLTVPQRWIFPAGSIIAASGYRVVKFDPDLPASTNFATVLNTGFGLKAAGDSIYLFNRLQSGGELLDSVSFGIQAPDWSIGRVPSGGSNWVLNLPSQGGLNLATTLGNRALLKINEWMAAPSSGADWFEIFSPSAQPVELSGLYLTDDLNNRLQYPPIPARSYMAAGLSGFLKIVADNDTTGAADHVRFALSRDGESLGISDPFGVLIDQVTFGSQFTAVSQGRLPDGTTSIVLFPGTESPEESNYLPIPNLVINEVLTHSDLPLEDAIELRNTSASAISIGGWYLSDSRTALRKYRIPNGVSIPANGYRVFYENQFNPIPNDPGSFSLSSASGDQVYLSATDAFGQLTGYRLTQDFGAAANGVSFGRYITSALNGNKAEFTAMIQRTFGVDNPQVVEDFRNGTGLANSTPRVGPVVISEIMYHPPDLAGGIDDSANEFVELRNLTSSPVPLYDLTNPANVWRLKDAVSFHFPPNTSIAGNGFILVVSFHPSDTARLNAFRTKYAVQAGAIILGPYSGKLANSSASVELARPDAPETIGPDAGLIPYILVDKVKYFDAAPWPATADGTGQSLTRVTLANFGNDPVNWSAATPTPGPQGPNPDTDGDGMDDAWENTYFGNLSRNGTGDFDGDGLTDLQEFNAGTDPKVFASALRLQVVDTLPTVLQFNATANRLYTIEYKNSLSAPSWSLLHNEPAGAARLVTITDVSAPPANRFYRVRTP
jgi:hypothetical protein